MIWSEFKVWVQALTNFNRGFLFRGQSDPTWKLQTTFHRSVAGKNVDLQFYRTSIIPKVHHYVCAHFNEILDLQDPDTFGAYLALLQHHGFPTPLLDWTLSPYIAAYFAIRDSGSDPVSKDSVKVFAFDYQEWEKHFVQPLDLREDTKMYLSTLTPHAKYNPRLVPQQCHYTVTNVADIEGYLDRQGKEVGRTFLYSETLPVSERATIMRELSLMGITEMALFPGMDGICRSLKERFFNL